MEKTILSSEEAAIFLGISKNQLYKLSSTGKLRTYSPTGGKIYFLQSELEEWVLDSPKGTVKEVQCKATRSLISKI